MTREDVIMNIQDWDIKRNSADMALYGVLSMVSDICDPDEYSRFEEEASWSIDSITVGKNAVEITGNYQDEYFEIPLLPEYCEVTPEKDHPRIQWWWASLGGEIRTNLKDVQEWVSSLEGLDWDGTITDFYNSVNIVDADGAIPNPGEWIVYNPDTKEFYFE